jgi:hypothetical protein
VKDYTRAQIEAADCTQLDALDCIRNGLEILFMDQERTLPQTAAHHPITGDDYTYEELLGTLLAARHEIMSARRAGFTPDSLKANHDEDAEASGDWKNRFGEEA